MIRALLDGKKTQTRRIVKSQPQGRLLGLLERPIRSMADEPVLRAWFGASEAENSSKEVTCPYGKPGDLLWIREAFIDDRDEYDYALSSAAPYYKGAGIIFRADVDSDSDPAEGWKPSIHMPRWASRVTLELIEVRVERLWDISEADALAEGVNIQLPMFDAEQYDAAGMKGNVYREQYRKVWESINGLDSWDANPWVWALSFDVHRCNVDELFQARVA
jgi:hypothetical protein